MKLYSHLILPFVVHLAFANVLPYYLQGDHDGSFQSTHGDGDPSLPRGESSIRPSDGVANAVFERDSSNQICSPAVVFGALQKRYLEVLSGTPQDYSVSKSARSNRTWLHKRVMPLPDGDTPADVDTYFEEQMQPGAFTDAVKTWRNTETDVNSAVFEKFDDENEISVGERGLTGCSGLLVISKKAVYMTHWWESLSMYVEESTTVTFTNWELATNQAAFEAKILKPLTKGAPYHPSLTSNKAYFDADSDPKAFLMMPMGDPNRATHYRTFQAQIQAAVRDIIGIEPELVSYAPNYKRAVSANAGATGAMLAKYDPKERPEAPTHRIRVWIETALKYAPADW